MSGILQGVFDGAKKAIGSSPTGKIDDVMDNIQDTGKISPDEISTIQDRITALQNAGQDVAGLKDKLDTLKTLPSIASRPQDLISGLPSRDDISGFLQDKASDVVGGVVGGIKKRTGDLPGVSDLKGLGDRAKGALGGLNDIKGRAGDALDKLGDLKDNIGDLAKGGLKHFRDARRAISRLKDNSAISDVKDRIENLKDQMDGAGEDRLAQIQGELTSLSDQARDMAKNASDKVNLFDDSFDETREEYLALKRQDGGLKALSQEDLNTLAQKLTTLREQGVKIEGRQARELNRMERNVKKALEKKEPTADASATSTKTVNTSKAAKADSSADTTRTAPPEPDNAQKPVDPPADVVETPVETPVEAPPSEPKSDNQKGFTDSAAPTLPDLGDDKFQFSNWHGKTEFTLQSDEWKIEVNMQGNGTTFLQKQPDGSYEEVHANDVPLDVNNIVSTALNTSQLHDMGAAPTQAPSM